MAPAAPHESDHRASVRPNRGWTEGTGCPAHTLGGAPRHDGNFVFVGSSVVAGAYGHSDGSRLDRISSCLALWATLA